MRAGSLEVVAVLSQAPSSNSTHATMRSKGGEGMRRVEGRMMSTVNGESIVCVATTESKWKEGSKMQHNSEGSNALYSTPSTRKNED